MSGRRFLRPGRAAAILTAVLALFLSSARADRTVLLTFTGDCTLGSTEATRKRDSSLDTYAALYGYDYFLANFAEMFSGDDATIVNLECVLSDSAKSAKVNKNFCFRGPTAFTRILSGASVEVAVLANNHALDYGSAGLAGTQRALEDAGITWIRLTDGYTVEKDGIRVAVLAVDSKGYHRFADAVCGEITRLKASGEAQAVVAIYHGGKEYVPKHYAVQTNAAQRLVDAGADLVIMHHPHVVQGVSVFGNSTVCYSLGNFVFGGNTRVRTKTYDRTHVATSLYGLVVQAELRFSDDGAYLGQEIRLYPIFTTGSDPINDFQPRPVRGAEAEAVLECVRFDSSVTLPAFDESLGCAVLPFLEAAQPTPQE